MAEITLSLPRLRDWPAVWRLYRTAFPSSERKPFFIILRMVFTGGTHLWCILNKGRFAGFASTVNSPRLILLDYLAVCPDHRGQGIGSAAMARLLEIYRDKGLFVEIESTDLPGEDLPLRLSRKRFYTQAGLMPLNVTADVFGVRMELLGRDCAMDFDGYQSFYRDNYSAWAAEHICRCDTRL